MEKPVELEAGDFITLYDYLMEQSLIIGTGDGVLLLYDVHGSSSLEVVGGVEGGVTCIAPSTYRW